MPQYVVEVPEPRYRRYLVAADDKRQAALEVQKGHGTALRVPRTPRGLEDDSPRVYEIPEYYPSVMQEDREEAAKEAARELMYWINDMGADFGSFIETLHREHRTLQQKATGLFLQWLYSLADLKENQHDLRNKAAVEAARKIKEALGDGRDRLPCI